MKTKEEIELIVKIIETRIEQSALAPREVKIVGHAIRNALLWALDQPNTVEKLFQEIKEIEAVISGTGHDSHSE